LGIGPNPQSPIPNPQSPIPNPHYYFFNKPKTYLILKINLKLKLNLIKNGKNKIKSKSS